MLRSCAEGEVAIVAEEDLHHREALLIREARPMQRGREDADGSRQRPTLQEHQDDCGLPVRDRSIQCHLEAGGTRAGQAGGESFDVSELGEAHELLIGGSQRRREPRISGH